MRSASLVLLDHRHNPERGKDEQAKPDNDQIKEIEAMVDGVLNVGKVDGRTSVRGGA